MCCDMLLGWRGMVTLWIKICLIFGDFLSCVIHILDSIRNFNKKSQKFEKKCPSLCNQSQSSTQRFYCNLFVFLIYK